MWRLLPRPVGEASAPREGRGQRQPGSSLRHPALRGRGDEEGTPCQGAWTGSWGHWAGRLAQGPHPGRARRLRAGGCGKATPGDSSSHRQRHRKRLSNPSSVHTPQRKPPTRFVGRGISQAGWLGAQAGPVHRARSHRSAPGSPFEAAQEELVSLDEIRDGAPQPWSTRLASVSSTSLPPAGPSGPAPCDRLPLTRLRSWAQGLRTTAPVQTPPKPRTGSRPGEEGTAGRLSACSSPPGPPTPGGISSSPWTTIGDRPFVAGGSRRRRGDALSAGASAHATPGHPARPHPAHHTGTATAGLAVCPAHAG